MIEPFANHTIAEAILIFWISIVPPAIPHPRATSSGYGFIANLGDLQTKNKSGKAAIKVQENAKVLFPSIIKEEQDVIAAITNQGRMLVFPYSELPQLARGKGNKIIGIPKSNFQSGEEFL